MSATSGGGGGGGGSVSEGSEAGESSHSTMSVSDSPSTSFQKHADNVTKISLTEGMVSGGFDVTGSKMNLTTEERQGKDGIVNMGFDYEEAANRGETGTDFKSINGSEKKDKVPEAVNLELVNMVPYSNGNGTNYGVPVNGIPGIPTKKDSEQVDTSTPYDEYFVPVNEHKKYMRGEKLYVTKDKRRPTSWRRCLSWIVACTVISVVLIVAILAGTGVILNQEPNLVQEASVGRNFAGSNLKPAVTQNAPTAEKFTYVPRSIESELVIDNLDFDPALKNANSSAYQDFAEAMESQLKMILFDKETLEHGASDVGLRVVNVSRDPFKVNYRIGWNYKQGVNNPPEPIKMEDVKRRLVESLAKNQGYIDKYHIDREAIKVNHVTDTCQLDNGGCSHICYYNYVTQQFTCTCPTHLILDSTGRNCVEWTGFEDDAVPVPSRPGSYESTSNTPLEQEHSQGIHYEQDHHNNQHQYEEASPEPEPEPNGQDDHEPQAEPEPSSDDSDGKDGYYTHDHDHDHMHSVYGSVGEPTAEPEPEPSAEPDSHSDDSHSVYGSKGHEPVAEPTAEPAPEPAAEPSPEPAPESSSEPSAEPSPEPAAEPDSHSDDSHSVYGSKGHEPVAEPTAEPSPEPNAESDTHSDDKHSVYGSKEHEPVAEPTAEPSPEPNAESDTHSDDKHSVYGSKGHEPVAEPTAEPSPEPNAESDTHSDNKHSVYGSEGHEPVAEPTAEPSPEPNAESDTHSEDSHSVYGSKGHESVAEPTAEPSPEPSPEPAAEPNSESASSSSAEHSSESSSETSAEPSPESASSPADDHSSEPAAEPSPDSAAQPNSEHDLKSQPTSESPVKSNDEHKLYIPYQSSEPSEPTEVPKSTTESSQSVMSHEQNVSFGHEGESAQGIESVTGSVPGSSSEPAPEPTADDSQDKTGEHSPGSTDKPETVYNIHSVHGPQETEPSVQTESPVAKPSPDEQTSSIATDHEPASEPTPEPSPEESGLATGVKSHKTEQPESGSDDHRSVQEHTNHFDAQTTTESNSGVEHHKHLEDILIKALPDGQNASEFNPLENVKVTADGQPIVEEVVLDKSDSTLVKHPETTTHAVKSDISSQSDSAQVTTEVVSSASTEGPITQKEGKSDEKTPADENVTMLGIVQHEQLAPGVSNLTAITEESKQLSQPKERTPQSQEPGHQDTSTTMNPHHESQTIPVNVISFEGNTQAQTFGPPVSDHTEHTPSREVHEGKNENGDVAGVIHHTGGHDVTNSHLGVTTLPVDENGLKKSEVNKNEAESNETKSPEELLNSVKDLDNEAFNTLVDKEYKSKSGQPEEKYPNKKVEKKKIKDYVKGDKTLPESTVKPAVTPEDFILQKHVNGNGNAFDLDYSLQNEHTTEHDSGVSVGGHEIDGVPGVVLKPQGINNHDISVLQTVAPDFRTETIYPGVTHEWETKLESKTKPDDFKPEKDYKFDKDYKFEKQKGGKKKELKKKGGGKDGKNVELDDGRKYFGDVGKDDEISREVTDVNSFDKFTIQPGMKIASDYNTEAEVRSETTVPNDGVSVAVTEEIIPRQNHPDSRGPVVYYDGNPPADHTGHLMVEEPNVSTTDVTPGTVYDGIVRFHDPVVKHIIMNTTLGTTVASNDTDDTTFVVYQTTDAPPVIADGFNSTTAHPTIIVHGQSGNLQDGHSMRFSNSTIYNPSNATVISMFKGNLTHPDGHSFSFTNLTATFPNGSAVHPTIVVHGQSGALQNGHESRFGNSTIRLFENSTVYKIENSSLPGTVFDGHFNPAEGNYHMYTNSSGTFVYRNVSTRPFVIKGQSGDFGNSRVYILENDTKVRPESTIAHRNATVFTIGNVTGSNINAEIQEVTVKPYEVGSRQGTAYKVNDYFGYISKCAAGQFQCTNGTSRRGSACISLSSKCDSINDCSDGSDELGCIENGCPGNFQCSDGSCLKRNLVCNGIVDCSDGKDEKNCENWKCQFDEFQCPSGRCIPVVWQCDNKPDCDNHTDEFNCQSSCGNDEYFCPEGWCVPLTYKCNGVKECKNGEDEQFCDCSHEEFKCQTGGCVAASQVCNGVEDCPDRSDEWDCIRVETDSNLLKIRTPSGGYEPVCADEWSSRHSDEVCSSLGYFSSAPVENENNSSISLETSFYVLKNDSVVDFNQTFLVNLGRTNGTCSSGKLVEINCQEFSCGSRSMVDSSSVDARLVGGMSVTAGQWPSVALLYNTRTLHSCTANVITPRWVLASYNCLKMGNKYLNEQDWKFFGGSTVFEAEKEDAETRRIVRVIPHPQLKFNQFLFSNDLALVELDQPLPFSSNIGAVCLPEQEIQPRQICVTAGWGMNSPEDKSIRQHLQYLPVPTMNLTECNSTEHYSGFITDDKICAGYNGAAKSLCYNEEGAPLMCVNDRGEWELQGVMSYHSNCGRGSHPSIFSSITPVKDWIKKTIGNNFERKLSTVTNR